LKKTILVIDENLTRRKETVERLSFLKKDAVIREAETVEEALGITANEDICAVVIDEKFAADSAELFKKPGVKVYAAFKKSSISLIRAMGQKGIKVITYPVADLNIDTGLEGVSIDTKEEADAPGSLAEVVVFLSPKGGTGKTLLAVSFAVAARRNSSKKVCLVDLAWPSGGAADILRFWPPRSVMDLNAAPEYVSEKIIKNVAPEHPQTNINAAVVINDFHTKGPILTPQLSRKIISVIARHHDLLVVDTGAYSESVEAVLPFADRVFFVTDPLISSIVKTYRLFDFLRKLNRIPVENSAVIINFYNSRYGDIAEDVQSLFKTRVFLVPFDYSVIENLNEEKLPITVNPRSAFSKSILNLAAENNQPMHSRRLFNLFRK
jgi:MinD-like ATPase involved in chromosome partitioning or flagellar assembly